MCVRCAFVYICVFVVCQCMCMHGCTCIFTHGCGVLKLMSVVFLNGSPPYSCGKVPQVSSEFPGWVTCLAQIHDSIFAVASGGRVAAWSPNFLRGFWGSELWSSCLHCNCVFQLVSCLPVLLAFWKMTTIDIQIKISEAIPSKQNLLKGLTRTHSYEISVPQG